MTASVSLRRLDAADRAAFRRAVADSDHLAPWTSPPSDDAGFDAWLARASASDQALWVIVEGERLAGYVNASAIVRGAFCSAYLGYAGFAGALGRGVVLRGVALAIDACFDELALHRVEANVQPGNARSRQLVHRLGFRLEGYSPRYLHIDGQWRDHERWALTAEEWPGADAVAARERR